MPVSFLKEYHSLDQQLDQLADYLTVLEGRSDQLTQDARQLLQEARDTRHNGVEVEEQVQNGSSTEWNGDHKS